MNEEVKRKESRLTGLYIQRTHLKEKLSVFIKRKTAIDKEIKITTDKLEGVQKGIDHLEERDILITTHFQDRYRERVEEATEEEIRTKVLTPQFCNILNTLGNGAYPWEQYTIIVQDRKLVSIYLTDKYLKNDKQRNSKS